MSQPQWEFLENLGDADPLEHGGYFVYKDTTGVCSPEAALIEPDSDKEPEPPDDADELWDADEEVTYTVHRFALEPCTFINGVLSDNEFHPDHPAWFKPEDVAKFGGLDVEELIGWFTSGDPLQLAEAYRLVGGFYGFNELDDYPLTLTRREVKEMYARELKAGR